jgi:hypothetical protein
MKKMVINGSAVCSVLLFLVFFNGCVKDSCTSVSTYSYYIPVYRTRAEVRANIKSDLPREVNSPGKIVIQGKYIFLNEVDEGIHVIDNSDPASPHNVAFINIPGNMDLALKGNTLYADLYTDLVTLDITDPLHVVVKKYNDGVFPFRAYGNGFYNDTSMIISRWIKRDTSVAGNCGGNFTTTMDSQAIMTEYSGASTPAAAQKSSSPAGTGGSMARFAIVKDRLYTVSNSDLSVFNIASPSNPAFTNKLNLGNWQVETIFPFRDQLFIGSQNGVFVYDISHPDDPFQIGQFAHVQSCDPVISDGHFVYVTLRTGSSCFGNANQLKIFLFNSFTQLTPVKDYDLTNPHGLSKDGDLLFICDGTDGLKIYNSSDVADLKLIKTFGALETYDVIATNHIALVVARDGLYQYDYTNTGNIYLISKIGIKNNQP